MASRRPSVDQLEAGVRAGSRALLARAITLVESTHARHRQQAQQLLARLLPATGGAVRVGITGPPGVGKSTLLDALGIHLVQAGHRVAVLAVDPSSSVTGGSILGDKTRMARLSATPQAFIRPSPAGRTLGGVARRTREALLLCEAAGFDVVLVETVGVGQSEIAVAELVDTFVVLAQPGSGDELQGIKKGVLELADVLAVNKADGDNRTRAELSLRDHRAALRYLRHRRNVAPASLLVSGQTGEGLPELWAAVLAHREQLGDQLRELRADQAVGWLRDELGDRLWAAFDDHATVAARRPQLEAAVRAGTMPPGLAADELIALFRG
jgi:LAO/AO transport system kinase